MLRSILDLEKYAIGAEDGPIGRVQDFYFDDESWVVRYVVVETGAWLASRRVLISPFGIGTPDWNGRVLPVSISRQQVKNSPNIDTDKPVTRQHEMDYLGYYGYPYYWGGSGLWGEGAYPGALLTGPAFGGADAAFARAQVAEERSHGSIDGSRPAKDDPHLRSCNSVKGYHIHASDGDIGHVQGYLVDEDTWAIQYLIVDTSNWWLGHQVIVAPEWITAVSWLQSKVTVDLTRQAVKEAPRYDWNVPLNRDAEAGLYGHYRRPGYWHGRARRAVA